MSNSMPPDEARDVSLKARASENPLHALMPPEPDGETLARIWHAVEPQLTPTSEQRLAAELRAVTLPEPDSATLNRIWLKTARELREPQRRALAPFALRYAAIVAALVLFLIVSVNGLSASALPGSPLYGVKRFGEVAREVFAWNDAARAQLALERADARLDEARKLIAQNAPPALVRQTLMDAIQEVNVAAPFVAPHEIENRQQQLSTIVRESGIPFPDAAQDLIQTPTPFVSPTSIASATRARSTATPTPTRGANTATATLPADATFVVTALPSQTFVPTLGFTPTWTRSITNSLTPPSQTPTGVNTPTPLVAIPTLPINATGTANTPNATALPTDPSTIPTDTIPTIAPPTIAPPTIPPPTIPPPTIVPPTIVPPTLPLPTIPPPTLPLPTVPLPIADSFNAL